MKKVFVFELPFDYTLNLTTMELLFWGLVILVILIFTIKSFFLEVRGGREGLSGQSVVALEDFLRKDEIYEGKVQCMGEIWIARADFSLKKGDRSIVSKSEGLILFLNKNDDANNQQNSAEGA